jgi:hypothetical protein
VLPGLKAGAVAAAIVIGGIQLVPYGHDHSNPAVRAEAPWPDDESRAIAERSCYDCHSNETDWPWYSNVAPMSWLVQHDVDEGRSELNFSEWPPDDADDLHDPVEHGEMPPAKYTRLHGDAKLSAAERDHLEEALRQMERDDDHAGRGRGGSDDDDD